MLEIMKIPLREALLCDECPKLLFDKFLQCELLPMSFFADWSKTLQIMLCDELMDQHFLEVAVLAVVVLALDRLGLMISVVVFP